MTATSQNTLTAPTSAQWDAANKFLGQLFVNSTLAQGYLNICQQANGQTNAPEMLNNWLSSQGYDTTPELVYAALIALQNTTLGYWLGVYGQSFLDNDKSAPVLVIAPDTQNNIVPYLNGVELKNYTFKSVQSANNCYPTLSWGFDSNSSAGNITFYYTSPITTAPNPPTGYTGNWFQGKLQTSATGLQQTFYGALVAPNTVNNYSDAYSINDFTSQAQAVVTSEWFYIALGLLGGLTVTGALVFRYQLGRWPFQNSEEQEQIKRQLFEDNPSDFKATFQDAVDKLKVGKVQDSSLDLSVILEAAESDEYDPPLPPEALSPKASVPENQPSSEPPAPETQPVPPQENPLAQQEKTEVGQPQVAPVPSEQQPVQGSQAEKIQNASNSLGTETSTPQVQQPSPDVQQTSPDKTKNESEFDPLAEGE